MSYSIAQIVVVWYYKTAMFSVHYLLAKWSVWLHLGLRLEGSLWRYWFVFQLHTECSSYQLPYKQTVNLIKILKAIMSDLLIHKSVMPQSGSFYVSIVYTSGKVTELMYFSLSFVAKTWKIGLWSLPPFSDYSDRIIIEYIITCIASKLSLLLRISIRLPVRKRVVLVYVWIVVFITCEDGMQQSQILAFHVHNYTTRPSSSVPEIQSPYSQ